MPSENPRRTLILWRHAKAEDNHPGGDHARPLTPKGTADAARVAAALAEAGWDPDLVLLSDSARTIGTWAAAEDIWISASVDHQPSFYGGSPAAVKAALERLTDATRTVVVLGHNPGWSELASELAGRLIGMRKADALVFQSDAADWAAAVHGPWTLVTHVIARELHP